MTDEADGGLIVKFVASGWVEMAWHVDPWGNTVEVNEPQDLRNMVASLPLGKSAVMP
jgi:predicted DNA-binding transcriptional regulator YafY